MERNEALGGVGIMMRSYSIDQYSIAKKACLD